MNKTIPKNTIDLSEKSFGINPMVGLIREGDHGYLYDHKNASIQVVNNTALLILEFCNEKYTINDIIDKLSALFPSIPRSEVEADITAFIVNLIGTGVVILL